MRLDPRADMCRPTVDTLPALTAVVRDLAIRGALVPVVLAVVTRVIIRTRLCTRVEDAAAISSSVVIKFTEGVS